MGWRSRGWNMDETIIDEPEHPQKLTNTAPETLIKISYAGNFLS